MSIFSAKLNTIANNTNSYLKSFFLKQKKNYIFLNPILIMMMVRMFHIRFGSRLKI